ncbi:MAG: aminoacyl-tRNA hydrolase [Calditrichaeota bacterium]|nr:aminoacyl-tRNA hydrolase [Calditrichota bacterium]
MINDTESRYLIVGLGNPGRKYRNTRHNVGFMVLDRLAEELGLTFKQGRGDYLQASGRIKEKKVALIKPLTFMNNSGLAVRQAVQFYKSDLSHILVIVDDFQIPLGVIRIRKQGSDGGHNGLASIMSHLGTKNFPRLRVGIGREAPIDNWITFVLSDFSREEKTLLEQIIPIAVEAAISFVVDGIETAMNKYNRKRE